VPSWSDFGDLLANHLKRRHLSARAFAKRVRIGTSFLRYVMLGSKPVPEKRIEPWADVLELAGEERERFVDEAWLSHCPDHVRKLVARLRKR
jgi:hypothetical protein